MYLDTKAWMIEKGITGEALLRQLDLEKVQSLYYLVFAIIFFLMVLMGFCFMMYCFYLRKNI